MSEWAFERDMSTWEREVLDDATPAADATPADLTQRGRAGRRARANERAARSARNRSGRRATADELDRALYDDNGYRRPVTSTIPVASNGRW